MLSDSAARSTIMLMPERHVYMDAGAMGAGMADVMRPLNPDDPCPQWRELMKRTGPDKDAEWTCRRVGNDTVNGRATVKYEGVSAKGEHRYVWIDPKLRYLVKAESDKGNSMELRNIQEGPQPASLFEIPAGYQKLDISEMMKRAAPPGVKPPG